MAAQCAVTQAIKKRGAMYLSFLLLFVAFSLGLVASFLVQGHLEDLRHC